MYMHVHVYTYMHIVLADEFRSLLMNASPSAAVLAPHSQAHVQSRSPHDTEKMCSQAAEREADLRCQDILQSSTKTGA